MGQATARALGFIPEVCRQKACDARLELLDYYGANQVLEINQNLLHFFGIWILKYLLNHLRWAKNHGPKDHPAVMKLLATAGI